MSLLCLSSLAKRVPDPVACGTDPRSLCDAHGWIHWGWSRGESNAEKWLPKTFSCNPDVFHVSRGKRLSRLSMERELGIIAGWQETQNNLPLWFVSTSWNSPESLIEFICSCVCCNWDVSFCIVSWFPLNFALRLRQLVVLELPSFLPFRACFGFEYLGEPFHS